MVTLKRPQVLEEQRQSFDTELAALRAKHAEELAVVRAAAKVAAASVSPDGACPSIITFYSIDLSLALGTRLCGTM